MTRVLFVCLGNICRSPSAEAVVRDLAKARGVRLSVDSAGTGDWHVGKAPYGPMIAAAARRGYDLSGLKARQVRAADFAAFHLIVAMDRQNRADLEALRPAGNATPVRLMLDHLPDPGPQDVPDPYYTRDFDAALDLIEAAAEGLLGQLEQNASAVSPKTE